MKEREDEDLLYKRPSSDPENAKEEDSPEENGADRAGFFSSAPGKQPAEDEKDETRDHSEDGEDEGQEESGYYQRRDAFDRAGRKSHARRVDRDENEASGKPDAQGPHASGRAEGGRRAVGRGGEAHRS